MSLLAGSAFLKALGWALLNSLWQFAILFVVFKLITTGAKKMSATMRHLFALITLVTGSAWFTISLSWKYYTFNDSGNSNEPLTAASFSLEGYQSFEQLFEQYLPYWSVLYLACILILFAKFCIYISKAGAIGKRETAKMPVELRLYIDRVAAQLGITRKIRSALSSGIDSPQVIGFLKPVILVPIACVNNLTTEQLETVLLHELVHIRRHDYLINLFVSAAEILFFFNPFVRRMATNIRKEREYSCDDMVIQFQYHPHNYATALLTLEKSRTRQPRYSIAANGSGDKQLLDRIQRIVGVHKNERNISRVSGYVLALMLLGFVATVNPARVAVNELSPGVISFTGIGNGERSYVNENSMELAKVEFKGKPAETTAEISVPETTLQEIVLVPAEDDEDVTPPVSLIASVTASEGRAFSLTLPKENVGELQAEVQNELTPYVPSNNFSYHILRDTTIPSRKAETYRERLARESMEQAKKAIEKIDWKKLEKELKYNKSKLSEVKLQLLKELAALNWQQINSEVQTKLNDETLMKAQDLQFENQQLEVARQYQQAQLMYNSLEKQRWEKEQVLLEIERQKAASFQDSIRQKKVRRTIIL